MARWMKVLCDAICYGGALGLLFGWGFGLLCGVRAGLVGGLVTGLLFGLVGIPYFLDLYPAQEQKSESK